LKFYDYFISLEPPILIVHSRQSSQPAIDKIFGPLIAIYQDRPLRWRDLITTFIPAALAVLSPYLYGLQRAQYARTNYGPAAVQNWSRPWFLLSTAALIPLLLFALRRLRRSHRIVRLYKNGISIQGMGWRNRNLFWADISGISNLETQTRFLGIPLGNKCLATLHPTIGKPVRLDHRFPHLDELCARIKAKIYPRLIPEMRSSLLSGSTLFFGPIDMNIERINIQGRHTPWVQISGIQVSQGRLMIEFEDQRIRKIPVKKIPNIEIFIQLIQEGLVA
jgi:hypothetical protein